VGTRFSAPVQAGRGAHSASCTVGTGSFPGVKTGRGLTLTPHSILVLWSWKSWAISLLPLMGRTACTDPQCLYKGARYLFTFKWCQSLTKGHWQTSTQAYRQGAGSFLHTRLSSFTAQRTPQDQQGEKF